MAKKRHASSEKRHGVVTVDELCLCKDDLQELATSLTAALKAAQALKTEAIPIDGATKWVRGFELLHQYLNNVNKGIRDTRAAERGR